MIRSFAAKKEMELRSSHQAVLPHIGTNNNGRHLPPPESVTIVHPSYIQALWPQATTHRKYIVIRYTRNLLRQRDIIRSSYGCYKHNTHASKLHILEVGRAKDKTHKKNYTLRTEDRSKIKK